MNKIESKIVSCSVVDKNKPKEVILETLSVDTERPDLLVGITYKLKIPTSDHAIYITINDIILNKDTEYESRKPFEIFINSKNMEQYQWIVSLTRLITIMFKAGISGDIISNQLKEIFDPKGGYFVKGKGFMPSLVANIGAIIQRHIEK
jgi:hypothetical protein